MSYDPNRDTCETCRFFVADDDPEEGGECHRMPPSYISRAHVWAFAAVTADNSCGEFDSIISDDHANPKNCH